MEPPGGPATQTEESQYDLSSAPVAQHIDYTIKKWAEYGYSEDLKRRLRKGDASALPKHLPLKSIPVADLTRWETQLNEKWLAGLDAFLAHPYASAALRVKDDVAWLVKDSAEKLRKHKDNTFFFGRIARKIYKKSIGHKIGRGIANFFRYATLDVEWISYLLQE
eukprot:GHVT01010551.1.p1 GENE.GHVT01010551.1~~GHVT01010551.1.p1  ORF type:complete len:165 (-),score=20.61 GHVT01010551.1:279-773(-)